MYGHKAHPQVGCVILQGWLIFKAVALDTWWRKGGVCSVFQVVLKAGVARWRLLTCWCVYAAVLTGDSCSQCLKQTFLKLPDLAIAASTLASREALGAGVYNTKMVSPLQRRVVRQFLSL